MQSLLCRVDPVTNVKLRITVTLTYLILSCLQVGVQQRPLKLGLPWRVWQH